MDQAATGIKKNCYLTYGSQTANQMDSIYQTVNELVGNVDWGESLFVVACDFPGLNTMQMEFYEQEYNLAFGSHWIIF